MCFNAKTCSMQRFAQSVSFGRFLTLSIFGAPDLDGLIFRLFKKMQNIRTGERFDETMMNVCLFSCYLKSNISKKALL